MNLVVIGRDTDQISLDIWKGNTNYTVLNQNPYLWGKNFLEYIKDKDVIVSTNADQFQTKTINDFLEYMQKYDFIPVFISDGVDDIVNSMYAAVNDILQQALLYTRNDQNEEYDILLKITKDYLVKRIENNDKTVRTSGKRETGSSET